MNYVMSDIHGRIDLFEQMLKIIDLQDGDMLYILGDCIDRGGGLDVLKRIMQLNQEGKAILIRGNHEDTFLSIVKNHKSTEEHVKTDNFFNKREINILKNPILAFDKIEYMYSFVICFLEQMTSNDTWKSFDDFVQKPQNEKKEIIRFLEACPLYCLVDGFILVHAGVTEDGYASNTIRRDFYLNKSYFSENGTVIFGHTSTKILRLDADNVLQYPPTIWKKDDKIGIDCGACYEHGRLACLRLDDMKEYYVDNPRKLHIPINQVNEYLNRGINDCKNKVCNV